MNPIRIAVISDLHIGGARSADLCPTSSEEHRKETSFARDFIEFLESLTVKIDFLVLSGDITESLDVDELLMADKFVKNIINSKNFTIDEKGIFYVPGNHDVDWSVLKILDENVGLSEEKIKLRKKQRYDPFTKTPNIFNDILHSCNGKIFEEPYIITKRTGSIEWIGFNSSWHDDDKQLMHHGKITKIQLDQLDEVISGIPERDGLIKIFVLHHHCFEPLNPVGDRKDFSCLENSQELMNILQKHKIDFMLHGHTHQPRFSTISIDGRQPIAILSSGSLSVKLPDLWDRTINNQFHVITIDGRTRDGLLKGNVESWAYYGGHKWLVSNKEHDGIQGNEPFGYYKDASSLKKVLRKQLRVLFINNNYLSLMDVYGAIPDLKYIRTDILEECFSQLRREIGFKMHDEIRNPDKFLLLKI